MSSDWGRNLSATRLRRAGGLSVSSGMSSVSWDSELSPAPITPLPLPPVNAPPDTIYVIRANVCDIYFLHVSALFRRARTFSWTSKLSGRRSKDVWKIKIPFNVRLFYISSGNRSNLSNALRRHSNVSWKLPTELIFRRNVEKIFLSLFRFLTSICIPLSPLLHLAFRAALLPFFLSLLLLQTSGPNLNIFS